jgi:hypothetical protein
MTFPEVIAGLIKVLLGVSVLGVIGKLGFPRSWLFRSHRHEGAQPSDSIVTTPRNKLSPLSLSDSRFRKFNIKAATETLAFSNLPEKIMALEARSEARALAVLSLLREETKTLPPLPANETRAAINWENFRSTAIASVHLQELRNTKPHLVQPDKASQKAMLGTTKLGDTSTHRPSLASLKMIQTSKVVAI